MGFYSASDYMKASIMLLVANICLHVVAFGSPYWTTRARIMIYDEDMRVDVMLRTGGHAGLWTGCMEEECYERFNLWVAKWIKFCQAMMILSLICMVASAILVFLYMWHRDFDRDKRLMFLGSGTGFATPLFTGLAVIVWASSSYMGNGEQLNWPFYLAIFSFLISLVTSCFIYAELKRPLGERIINKSQILLVEGDHFYDNSINSWKS